MWSNLDVIMYDKWNGLEICLHLLFIYHLFPLVGRIFALDRLSGQSLRHVFFWSEVKHGLSPPVDLHLVHIALFEPVGEVLQWAVMEAFSRSEGFGIHEGGPTLEDLVGGPHVFFHIRVNGHPRWALVSLLWRPQCWNILGITEKSRWLIVEQALAVWCLTLLPL